MGKDDRRKTDRMCNKKIKGIFTLLRITQLIVTDKLFIPKLYNFAFPLFSCLIMNLLYVYHDINVKMIILNKSNFLVKFDFGTFVQFA